MTALNPPIVYTSVHQVIIRREPRIVEYLDGAKKFITNQVGLLKIGDQRIVYEIVTDNNNYTWGRISEPDGAGKSTWVCIRGLNRTYMEIASVSSIGGIENRVARMEQFLKDKFGYE